MRIVGAVVLSLVGCQGNIDASKLQQKIKEHFEKELGAELTAVTCPSNVPLKEGGSFECIAKVEEGPELKVAVEQTDDRGNVEWKLPSRVVGTKKFAKGLKKNLEQRGDVTIASIDCGGVRRSEPGMKFDCIAATKDGKQMTVGIVLGEKGTYRWQSKP